MIKKITGYMIRVVCARYGNKKSSSRLANCFFSGPTWA